MRQHPRFSGFGTPALHSDPVQHLPVRGMHSAILPTFCRSSVHACLCLSCLTGRGLELEMPLASHIAHNRHRPSDPCVRTYEIPTCSHIPGSKSLPQNLFVRLVWNCTLMPNRSTNTNSSLARFRSKRSRIQLSRHQLPVASPNRATVSAGRRFPTLSWVSRGCAVVLLHIS